MELMGIIHSIISSDGTGRVKTNIFSLKAIISFIHCRSSLRHWLRYSCSVKNWEAFFGKYIWKTKSHLGPFSSKTEVQFGGINTILMFESSEFMRWDVALSTKEGYAVFAKPPYCWVHLTSWTTKMWSSMHSENFCMNTATFYDLFPRRHRGLSYLPITNGRKFFICHTAT